MGLKVDCFVGFFHHPVMTMSSFMHVYRYTLLKVEQEQVCKPSLYNRMDRELLV